MKTRKALAVVALIGAVVAALGKGNIIAYAGIAFYALCIFALLMNFKRTAFLLFFAVGVHVLLTGYALYQWQLNGVVPCVYCLAAAGFALLAATLFTRPALAVVPLVLFLGVAFSWNQIVYSASLHNTAADSPQQKAEAAEAAPNEKPNTENQVNSGGMAEPAALAAQVQPVVAPDTGAPEKSAAPPDSGSTDGSTPAAASSRPPDTGTAPNATVADNNKPAEPNEKQPAANPPAAQTVPKPEANNPAPGDKPADSGQKPGISGILDSG